MTNSNLMPVTRQLRLTDPSVIRQRVGEFLGKKINIVLMDNRVLFGELFALKEQGIVLKNMRGKIMACSFAEINELYFDTVV